MPSSSHSSSSGCDERNFGEYWFWTAASRPPSTSCASRICSGFAFEIPGHPDLAGVEQLGDRAHRLRVRHVGVGTVELVQPDRLDPEPLDRRLGGLLEVLRPPVERPRPVTGARCPPLVATSTASCRRPTIASASAMSASLWPVLSGVEVVRVGRVDERHAGVQRRVDRRDRPLPVRRALDRHRHRRRARSPTPARHRSVVSAQWSSWSRACLGLPGLAVEPPAPALRAAAAPSPPAGPLWRTPAVCPYAACVLDRSRPKVRGRWNGSTIPAPIV